MGFLGVTSLMVLVTLLPYAVLKRARIADIRQPSMAGVLDSMVGHWGTVFISVGLLVSVLGAYLALIPFLLVALYGFLLVQRGETYDTRPEERRPLRS
jgi:amino acid transporter